MENIEEQKELEKHIKFIGEWVIQNNVQLNQLITVAAIYRRMSEVNSEETRSYWGLLQEALGALDHMCAVTKDSARELASMPDEMIGLMNKIAIASLEKGVDIGKKQAPRRNALKAHAEHHQFKKYVFSWLDENMNNYKSMDAAAEAIAGKIVPMKFRTVQGWISQWKKQRSASKL